MRLALIGYPIQHSASPRLYRQLLGSRLQVYDLLSIESAADLPPLDRLSQQYDGLNITAPYKRHFFSQVQVHDPIAIKLGAINTITWQHGTAIGTNTDAVAVRAILLRYQQRYPGLHLVVLGDGVMGRLTELIASDLKLPYQILSRKLGNINQIIEHTDPAPLLVINSCSRDFVLASELPADCLFWDYNYDFAPHAQSLPLRIKEYCDGQEMLELQAQAAIHFWQRSNAKLKC
jgi:shikimate dehydrogenase